MCALPSEMLGAPYWLTGCSVDEIDDENIEEYDLARQEFMGVFEQEEIAADSRMSFSKLMNEMWDSHGVWYWHCLSSVNAMYFLLGCHVLPDKRLTKEAEKVISRFWSKDTKSVIKKKLADKEAYDEELRALFTTGEKQPADKE
jgi:hypothetical protein